MQKKSVRTWEDSALALVWFLLEVAIFFVTKSIPSLCFLLCGLCFPIWFFVSSLICAYLPFLQWGKLTLYYSENLPEHRIYHILKADNDGYILYRENDTNLVSCWLIDNPIDKKSVKEIWNGF